MIKLPRFITEYTNYKTKCIMGSDLMKDDVKSEKIAHMHHATRLAVYGLITIDECMTLITRA